MKKILAIACVLCFAFATLTAFATETVENDVTVVTGYDVGNDGDANITVKATVGGVAVNDEITYYVAKGNDIVYIDQKTAQDTSVVFTFQATQGDVLASTAKNGSDKGYKFPTFTFAEGVNYQTKGAASAVETSNWGIAVSDAYKATVAEGADDISGYIYQGKISGKVSRYGVKVVDANENLICDFDAMGCDEHGNFVVIIDGYDIPVGATVKAFAE